jgi:hypothetical protein
MRTYRQVTEFEPKIAELLKRHADRLIASEPPRGLWVCEEDGEPLIALTVYTEPHVRISAIIDRPETKPFASLVKLADAFEEWATSIGLRAYGVVIDRGDDHYCKIIEKRGGVVLQQDSRWIEYLHEIGQASDTSDGIRPMRPSDWKALRPLVSAALREQGSTLAASFVASRTNVEAAIRIGVRAATKGDPCLVAYKDGAAAGFTIWLGHTGPFEMRERVCSAVALYAKTHETREALRDAALRVAWGSGYTQIDAAVRTSRDLGEWKSVGGTSPGLIVQIARPEAARKVA